uniref:cardiolipin synthase (CMP-forming) n=1 Tax=Cyclopterus lumpus TaxID=8103 RepID=A0A8C2WTG8_CYCLU
MKSVLNSPGFGITGSSGLFQCTNKLFLSDGATGLQIKEFARKNAANALSVGNMVMGMASILSSLNGHHHAACWLVLIGYLLDLADGAVARRLGACSALGAKLDDFADFTTFGIATALLLRTTDLLDNILCMCYVLSVFVRLCFFSSGIPFVYRGLPCIYSSAILASASMLSGRNLAMLRVIAVAMILFMISQNFYPHDRVLESQAWKKAVFAGGVVMVFCSSFPPACVYYLLCCEPETIMILLSPSSGLFQCTNKLFLSDGATGLQIKEFARKNAANALSVGNMVMGMASILSSINGHHHAACWLVLIGYLLDLADGAVARRLGACSASGAKLDDFADFTTFGIATSLLLRTTDLLDNILCVCYVLSVFVRLCFFTSGIPFMYRGLPCIYSSAILASASILSGGNLALLRVIAVAMILFMISQNFYPHDRVLESQAWKKGVYAGGIVMVFCSSFPPAC